MSQNDTSHIDYTCKFLAFFLWLIGGTIATAIFGFFGYVAGQSEDAKRFNHGKDVGSKYEGEYAIKAAIIGASLYLSCTVFCLACCCFIGPSKKGAIRHTDEEQSNPIKKNEKTPLIKTQKKRPSLKSIWHQIHNKIFKQEKKAINSLELN